LKGEGSPSVRISLDAQKTLLYKIPIMRSNHGRRLQLLSLLLLSRAGEV